MKAICVSEFGGPEVLKLVDVPNPRPPQSGLVRITERSGRGDFSKSFAIRKKLVDVTGFEPATPCLQIHDANLDGVKKDEKERG
jgi:hypothetical protein